MYFSGISTALCVRQLLRARKNSVVAVTLRCTFLNFINLAEIYQKKHELRNQGYCRERKDAPMVIKFIKKQSIKSGLESNSHPHIWKKCWRVLWPRRVGKCESKSNVEEVA